MFLKVHYELMHIHSRKSGKLRKVKVKVLVTQSCLTLVTAWTVAHQDPVSMGFSRQEYWSGLPFPSPGDLPNPGIELGSPAFQADTLTSEPPGKPHYFHEDKVNMKELQRC